MTENGNDNPYKAGDLMAKIIAGTLAGLMGVMIVVGVIVAIV